MGRFTIYKDNYVDSTVVSNRFIDEYMKDANDAQLKVYLYLIRMVSANLSTSVSEMADKFNHTEKDVLRALKYWEKNKLLSLDYDENKTLVGIHLQDMSARPSCQESCPGAAPVVSIVARQQVFAPPLPAGETVMAGAPAPEAAKPAQAAAPQEAAAAGADSGDALKEPQVSQSARVMAGGQAVPVRETAEPYRKPSYSLDQLKDFRNRADTTELFFIAESYLGKTLSSSDMKSILYFSDCLHFSNDLIDYLIQYCVDRGKRDFKYIEAVAINWAKEGVSTPRQAEKFSSKYDKSVYAIMKELGRNTSPTAKEMEFINRWTKEYGFTNDIIFEACERTVLATDKHRFEYAEGILSSWKKENVHHKSDIQKIDDLYQKRRAAKTSSSNKFNQFQQHNYDFDALEREILSN